MKIKLDDTIDLMQSEDYKDRFAAEYYQTAIRYAKLVNMINEYEFNMLEFVPNCPLELLKRQANAMHLYLDCLNQRAVIEHVLLSNVPAYEDDPDD